MGFVDGHELLYMLQDLRESLPTAVSDLFVFVDSTFFYFVLPLTLALWIYSTRGGEDGDVVLMTTVFTMGLVYTIKAVVNRPRPWLLYPDIEPYGPAVGPSMSPSFPSGHTAAVTASFTAFARVVRSRPVTVILMILGTAVIFGRLFLCVHTPLDVVAGIVVALVTYFAVVRMRRYFAEREGGIVTMFALCAAVSGVLTVTALLVSDEPPYEKLKYAGLVFGLILGRILDEMFVRSVVPRMELRGKARRFLVTALVSLPLVLIPYVVCGDYGQVAGGFMAMFSFTFLVPFLFKRYPGLSG